jgi:exopolysaccharide biosynthesis WecB/TagA/CpsF family protein
MRQILEEKFSDIHFNIVVSNTAPHDLPHHGIVFATHGNGKQEKLLAKIRAKFPDSGILMGVGGSIDMITGFRSPAPVFFQRFGGEWLYRLYKNPSRHLKRMKRVLAFLNNCLQK